MNIGLTEVTVFLLLISILYFIFLRRSMKRTLYSIWNVLLIAGILYSLISVLGIWLSRSILSKQLVEITGSNVVAILTRASVYVSNLIFAILAFESLLMAVSNLSLIRHEGKRLKNIYGTCFGLVFLAATVILRIIDIPYLHFMLCYFECVSIAIAIMGYIAAHQVPAYDKDYIIILGCSISKNGGLLPLLKQRVNRALRYAWEQEIASGKPLLFVTSGGQGPDEVMSEGSAMSLYLESHSVESFEVIAEKKSRNTWENFLFSKKIIDANKPGAKIAFATTNYHVFRSGMLARKAGIDDIEAISSKTKWYFWPNGFVRETIGIFAMTWKIHAIFAGIAAVLFFLLPRII